MVGVIKFTKVVIPVAEEAPRDCVKLETNVVTPTVLTPSMFL